MDDLANGEAWRRLRATFPASIATHSAEQVFYFDQQGLLKRHDYEVEISGRTAAAHYVSAPGTFSGIVVPTRHKVFGRQPDGTEVFGRQPDGTVVPAPLVVSIDLSEVEFN